MRFAALTLVLVAASACGSAVPAAPARDVGTRMSAALPNAVESIPLVDSSGRRRTLSDFTGKVLVISDSMTLCQETCPMDTSSLVMLSNQSNKWDELLQVRLSAHRRTCTALRASLKSRGCFN